MLLFADDNTSVINVNGVSILYSYLFKIAMVYMYTYKAL